MTDPDGTLAGLVASRICHDLVSPIGAICNGLELLQMDEALRGSAELELIESSVRHAQARIELFRVAFGMAGNGQIAGPALQKLLRDYFEDGRHEIHWQIAQPMIRHQAQQAILAILCVASALPRGGKIIATYEENRVLLNATGPAIKADPEVWSVFDGAAPDLAAGQVHFALLASLCRPEISLGETSVSLRL